MELVKLLSDFKLLALLVTLLVALFTTFVVMPQIVAISKIKNLTAEANERMSHSGVVPNLGGLGVFIGLLLSTNIAAVLFASYNQIIDLLIFNILLLLLLVIGVSDDIMSISPRKKMFFQLLCAFIFTFGTNIHIGSFSGLFGLYEFPYIIAKLFTVFVIVLIINAYNLIDGIDGLAGSIGAAISGVMAVVFYLSGHFLASLISVSLVGALSAFLVYNFSHRRKIFLGDTGSMVVGFVLAFQVVLYLYLGAVETANVFKNAPVFILALISYPLLDTLRVFVVRVKNGHSPFRADRNHIHHRLLDLGLSHKFATLILVFYTIIVTTIAYALRDMSINAAFAIMLPVCILFVAIPFIIPRKTSLRTNRFPQGLKLSSSHQEA